MSENEQRRADTPVRTTEGTGEKRSGGQECPLPGNVPLRGLNFDLEVTKGKRQLPHWEQDGACQNVTFRLGDSIPVETAQKWKAERAHWERHNPKPWNEKQRQQFDTRFLRRQESWLDQGLGECFLRRPDVRKIVHNSILKFNGARYDVDAFVIMPNHVHAVLQMRKGFLLAKELKSLKGGSARRCNQLLQRTGTFWQEESWDRLVRDAKELEAYRKYIAENPAKAGLREDEFTLENYNALEIYE